MIMLEMREKEKRKGYTLDWQIPMFTFYENNESLVLFVAVV